MTGINAVRAPLRSCLIGIVAAGFMAAAADGATRSSCSAQVDGLFAAWNRPDSPGAVVGIFDDGRILHAKGYGIADLDHGTPLSPRSVLRVGSVSKQFVGMAIALLAEQGRLRVSDDIRIYLPEMPDYGTPITLGHLLDHISGMSTSAYLAEHVFKPLGMNATLLHDDPNAIVPNRADGYAPTPEGSYRLDMVRLKVVGDLGIATTVEDLLLWDRNFRDNRLGDASAQLIETVMIPGKLNDGTSLDYGYGLIVGSYRGLKTVGHDGSEPGYTAHYLRFPGQRFSVVVLSNLATFEPERLARAIADRCMADRFTEPEVSVPEESPSERAKPTRPLDAIEVAAFAGDYYSDELDVVYRLRDRGGELLLAINALSGSLRTLGPDRLWWDAGAAELHFSRDARGKVTGFSLQSDSVHGLRFMRLGGDDVTPCSRNPPGSA